MASSPTPSPNTRSPPTRSALARWDRSAAPRSALLRWSAFSSSTNYRTQGGDSRPGCDNPTGAKRMTPEQILELAKSAAEHAADKAADKAVRNLLTALGIDAENLHKEQRVWAFARTMQQGTHRGAVALFTGFLTGLATLIAGMVWYLFFNKH